MPDLEYFLKKTDFYFTFSLVNFHRFLFYFFSLVNFLDATPLPKSSSFCQNFEKVQKLKIFKPNVENWNFVIKRKKIYNKKRCYAKIFFVVVRYATNKILSDLVSLLKNKIFMFLFTIFPRSPIYPNHHLFYQNFKIQNSKRF